MNFDKTKAITKMQPHADKLIADFTKKGITFQPTDGNLENVIFTSKDTGKIVKISHHSFYGYSRICCVCKDGKEKNSSETVEVTDAAFMENFMTAIITLLFKG